MIRSNSSSITLKQNQDIKLVVKFVDNLFQNPPLFLAKIVNNKKLFVVVDSNFLYLHKESVQNLFSSLNCDFDIYPLTATESNKTLETAADICIAAKRFSFKRDSLMVAIGGGVAMDIVGFAASMYKRKSQYIRIPTTLVGQVDAGVGVKVGVNHQGYKNLLGAYHAPTAVFIDPTLLTTLDDKEIRNGLYEILKMAIVRSERLFELVEIHYHELLLKKINNPVREIIYLSAFYMLQELDPNLHESNLRRTVDFGHTFSMYFEESTKYNISHGEAVGLDVLISSHIAYSRGLIDYNAYERIFNLINEIGFSQKYELDSTTKLMNHLQSVKDHRAGKLNLVLPTTIGNSLFTENCSEKEISKAIEDISKWIAVSDSTAVRGNKGSEIKSEKSRLI